MNYTHKRAEIIRALDQTLVVAVLCAFMCMANDFTRDCVGPFEVLSELGSEGAHVARRLRQRRTEIDRESHFAAECEAIRREACLFEHCRPIRLKHWREQRFLVVRFSLYGSAQQRDERAIEPLAFTVGLRPVGGRARLVDSKRRTQLGEERRLELRFAVRVQLYWHAIARNPVCVYGARLSQHFGLRSVRILPSR